MVMQLQNVKVFICYSGNVSQTSPFELWIYCLFTHFIQSILITGIIHLLETCVWQLYTSDIWLSINIYIYIHERCCRISGLGKGVPNNTFTTPLDFVKMNFHAVTEVHLRTTILTAMLRTIITEGAPLCEGVDDLQSFQKWASLIHPSLCISLLVVVVSGRSRYWGIRLVL